MGALVGAIYASGISAAEMRDYFLHLGQRPVTHMWKIAIQGALGFSRGFATVDAEVFTDAMLPEPVPELFEGLDIPLTVVAHDFHGRNAVGINTGAVRSGVAASLAVPGVFKPVRRSGRILIDGGITENLPLRFLPEVDLVLAVNVFTDPPSDSDEMPSQMETSMGALRTMMVKNVHSAIADCKPDILIEPDIPQLGSKSFWQVEELMYHAEGAREQARVALQAALDKHG